jgi:hypothetical protein
VVSKHFDEMNLHQFKKADDPVTFLELPMDNSMLFANPSPYQARGRSRDAGGFLDAVGALSKLAFVASDHHEPREECCVLSLAAELRETTTSLNYR